MREGNGKEADVDLNLGNRYRGLDEDLVKEDALCICQLLYPHRRIKIQLNFNIRSTVKKVRPFFFLSFFPYAPCFSLFHPHYTYMCMFTSLSLIFAFVSNSCF